MTDKISKNTRKATPTKAATVDDAKADAQTVTEDKRFMSELALSTIVGNANTSRKFAAGSLGAVDWGETINVMREMADKVCAGDLTDAETTLIAQAVALDSIFAELARRAAANMGQYLDATETYLRLALKAQSQCRATLETLAEIKNPRAVAFVRQQNVAVNQQVNNGAPSASEPRAHGNSTIQSIELSGAGHELPTDTGTPALAGAVNSQLETVAAIHRATNKNRQSQERRQ